MPGNPGRGAFDEGARYDAELDPHKPHPLRGVWIDGQPARFAPPDRQHTALIGLLLDRAEAEPRRQW